MFKFLLNGHLTVDSEGKKLRIAVSDEIGEGLDQYLQKYR